MEVFTYFNHALLHPVNEKLACQKLRRETGFLPGKFMFLDSLIPVYLQRFRVHLNWSGGVCPAECSSTLILSALTLPRFYPHYEMPLGMAARLLCPETIIAKAQEPDNNQLYMYIVD